MRKMTPVARRALGTSHITTLRMRWIYARALYEDDGATLDNLREAVTTLEDTERIARRVLGGAHPNTTGIAGALRLARAALHAREAEAVRVAERDATIAMRRDLDALQRRLVLLAVRKSPAVQMAEVEALQRDFHALERRLEAREARTVDSD